ncbi:MAG: TetR family transcriptional regulator [Bacteroidota bacterium]|nr:TetR family transcriptional regulator [Bacteroidota bacterium]
MTDKADKREHILVVAEALFGENGFDGTSVRDIANSAGVNLAMISYYFGSKEKLLESLIEFRAATAYGVLEDLNKDETLSPWEKIEGVVDYYVNKVLNNLRFHNIMYQQASNTRSEEIRELIMSIKLRNLEQIRKIITDGQKKGIFREVDVVMTIGTLMGTISSYTQSREYGCRILDIDYSNEETFRVQLAPRLKAHLKQLLRAHLDIKNEKRIK